MEKKKKLTVDSPARTRVAEIRKKFKLRQTGMTPTKQKINQKVTVEKRKAVAEEKTVPEMLEGRRKAAKFMETEKETTDDGMETSHTGPNLIFNLSNLPNYRKCGTEQEGQPPEGGEVPGRLLHTLWGGEHVRR